MFDETKPADIKAEIALEILAQSVAYLDAKAEISTDTHEYCEYLPAA